MSIAVAFHHVKSLRSDTWKLGCCLSLCTPVTLVICCVSISSSAISTCVLQMMIKNNLHNEASEATEDNVCSRMDFSFIVSGEIRPHLKGLRWARSPCQPGSSWRCAASCLWTACSAGWPATSAEIQEKSCRERTIQLRCIYIVFIHNFSISRRFIETQKSMKLEKKSLLLITSQVKEE